MSAPQRLLPSPQCPRLHLVLCLILSLVGGELKGPGSRIYPLHSRPNPYNTDMAHPLVSALVICIGIYALIAMALLVRDFFRHYRN